MTPFLNNLLRNTSREVRGTARRDSRDDLSRSFFGGLRRNIAALRGVKVIQVNPNIQNG